MVLLPRGEALPGSIPGGLSGRTAHGPLALLPGPLTPALRGWLERCAEPLAVGLEVPLREVGRSAAHARALRGIGNPGSLLAADHLPELLLLADPDIAGELRRQVLAPFEKVPQVRREPLLTTLRSWLLHAGNRVAVGRELHVHPQTVSYRMDRTRELVGADLEDPNHRWRLLLALMVEQVDPGPTSRRAGP
jgi:DNA-binding PucR family transcriptional regulator